MKTGVYSFYNVIIIYGEKMKKNLIKKFDSYFIKLINNKSKNKYFDKFFPKFTYSGGLIFIVVMILFIFIYNGEKLSRNLSVEIAVAQIFTSICVYFIKIITSRERPYDTLEDINTYGYELKDYSFPSGHSAAASAFATIIAINFPHLLIPMVFYALLVAMSRVYLAVHYPTDVVVGLMIGFAIAYLSHNEIFPMCLKFAAVRRLI